MTRCNQWYFRQVTFHGSTISNTLEYAVWLNSNCKWQAYIHITYRTYIKNQCGDYYNLLGALTEKAQGISTTSPLFPMTSSCTVTVKLCFTHFIAAENAKMKCSQIIKNIHSLFQENHMIYSHIFWECIVLTGTAHTLKTIPFTN